MTIEERKNVILAKIEEMKASDEEYTALVAALSEVYEDVDE